MDEKGPLAVARRKTVAPASVISTERRLLGWAVTLAGAALMTGGAMIAFLSSF